LLFITGVYIAGCGVSAIQTQLAQQMDTIKEQEERIAAVELEMVKVHY